MAEDDHAAGTIALALAEVLYLDLLERDLLDAEAIRESLEEVEEAMAVRHPELKATTRHFIDRIMRQTYAVDIKNGEK